MKKGFVFALIAVLFVLVSMIASAEDIRGIGHPYSIVPTEIGQKYLNENNKDLWIATSLSVSGWVKVPHPFANGSASAPFELPVIPSLSALEFAQFVPIPEPATPTLNMLFVASGTNELKFGVASGEEVVWKTISVQ